MGDATFMGNTPVQFQKPGDETNTMLTEVIWCRVHEQNVPIPAGVAQGVQKTRYNFFINRIELAGAYPDGSDVSQKDIIVTRQFPKDVRVNSIVPMFDNQEEVRVTAEFNF